jgi:very-short-patch-repair endonuclease
VAVIQSLPWNTLALSRDLGRFNYHLKLIDAMGKSHYNKKHTELARNLRKDGTTGEVVLWNEVLRAKQFHDYQFNRQFCIDNYIVDFISRKLKLIIEVDGYSHNFKYEEDRLRDKKLKELGYATVRLSEKEIRDDLDNVIRVLESYLPEE